MNRELLLPTGRDLKGIVIFAHGSGSSARSPRNRYVAERLVEGGYGTLLMDLLEEREKEDPFLEEDFRLLGSRVAQAVKELEEELRFAGRPMALYGASSGTAVAIHAGELLGEDSLLKTIVSRGGRPDLAGEAQERVRVPILFIVGSMDPLVLALNQEACSLIPGECSLKVVEGASHLFSEAGTLEEAARITLEWLEGHMGDQAGP